MDGAGSAWPGFICQARWLCETCPGFCLQALWGPWGFGVGMCWLPPLRSAAPGCWDNLGEQLQLLLCTSSERRAPAQFPRAAFHRRLSPRSLTASSLPAGMSAQACPQH